MKIQPVARSIIAAMVALSLAGGGTAWAGERDGRHDRSYSGGHHDKDYSYKKHHKSRERHHDKHYAYNRHHKKRHNRHYYKDRYRYKHYRGYGNHYYNYNDDDSDEKLLIGLLVGGLVGYAINEAQQEDSYENNSYLPPRSHHEAQPAIYESPGHSAATCLQEREYQTTVIVGGRKVDAYGTACLQPDGSWSRGPAKLASF